jgi:hypothetical protein
MKIFELFNNTKEPIDKVMKGHTEEVIDKDKKKLDFDLAEDLVYFMHHNDDFYRKNFYPVLKMCKGSFDDGKNFSHRVFKPLINKAYESYKKEFPIRELEDELEPKFIERTAKQIYETELGHMKDGKYD